jgi:hypothetical protein
MRERRSCALWHTRLPMPYRKNNLGIKKASVHRQGQGRERTTEAASDIAKEMSAAAPGALRSFACMGTYPYHTPDISLPRDTLPTRGGSHSIRTHSIAGGACAWHADASVSRLYRVFYRQPVSLAMSAVHGTSYVCRRTPLGAEHFTALVMWPSTTQTARLTAP